MIYYALDPTNSVMKIGCSRNVADRMRTLRSRECEELLLVATEPGSFGREHELLQIFGAQLVRGREWFRYDGELRRHVDALIAQNATLTTNPEGEPPIYLRHSFGWIDADEARLVYCGAIPVMIAVFRDIKKWCWNCRRLIASPWIT